MTYAHAYELARLMYDPKAPAHVLAYWRFHVSGALTFLMGADINWKGPCSIFIQETAFGTSPAVLKGNNLFGISHADPETGKWEPNHYPCVIRCCEAFLRLLHAPNYRDAWDNRQLPPVFLEKLHNAKPSYNANPTWLSGCLAANELIRTIVE